MRQWWVSEAPLPGVPCENINKHRVAPHSAFQRGTRDRPLRILTISRLETDLPPFHATPAPRADSDANNVFGPILQNNANVSIRITYYDDPTLAGAQIGLDAYDSFVNGIATISGAPPPPYNARAVLQGTGK